MDRPYHGWVVVGVGFVALAVVLGLTYSCFGLFVIPVTRELGLTRAQMNMVLIFTCVGGAVASPTIGRLCDRVPLKPLMLLSSLGVGAGMVILGLSHSLLVDALVLLVLLPFSTPGAASLVIPVLVTHWFRARLGRAMALTTMGMAASAALVPPIMGFLIKVYGWRSALVISGCGGTILLLAMYSLLRIQPRPGELEPDHDRPGEGELAAPTGRPLSLREVLGSAKFWIPATSAAIVLGVGVGSQATMIPLAIDSGLGMIAAATLQSARGLGAMAGQLALAIFADRIPRERLLTAIFLITAVLTAIPLVSRSYVMLLLMGIGLGVTGPILPIYFALMSDRFGRASFGTVQGLTTPFFAATSIVSARASGEAFDRTGSYDGLFAGFVVVLVAAAAMIYASRDARMTPRLAQG